MLWVKARVDEKWTLSCLAAAGPAADTNQTQPPPMRWHLPMELCLVDLSSLYTTKHPRSLI